MRDRLPKNLPPFVEPCELPDDPAASSLRDLSGWWLDIRCRCERATAYPLRLMAAEQPHNPRICDVLPRLRCRSCGGRPARVQLVDNPARLGVFHGSGAGARVYPLTGAGNETPP